MDGIDILIEQLRTSKIVDKGDYRYIINSIGEQDPPLDPKILNDCAEKLIELINLNGVNKILTAETMGVPIATAISMKTGIPLIIATKREKRTPTDVKINYVCGYEKGVLHFNSIHPGDKILMVDDLISTGGTIICMADAIKNLGATISDICVIFDKKTYGGSKRLKELGYDPKSLMDVDINKDNCIVERTV
jgi:adenine phosphoribosyltransferase